MKLGQDSVADSCGAELKEEKVIPVIALAMLKQGKLLRDLVCIAGNAAGDYCLRSVLTDLEVSTSFQVF